MKLTDAAMIYFWWALIINSSVLICASCIRAIDAKALWIWFGATILAYACYRSVLPHDDMDFLLDLFILWPLLLIAALLCIVRSYHRP